MDEDSIRALRAVRNLAEIMEPHVIARDKVDDREQSAFEQFKLIGPTEF